MKKLIAILLSMLLLCAMVPFATVAAADEPTAAAVIFNEDEEEVDTVNAGDTILVQVNLLNNPGVIAVGVEVVYDHDVFEVAAPYDEDEEAYFPAIEIGTTYKAQSNKYITFGPVDKDNEVMKKCSVFYSRGTASSNCDKEWFFTATFQVKDDAVSGDYTFEINFTPKSGANIDKELVNFASSTNTITVIGTEPEVPECEHEYEYDCSKNCSKCGEETRPEAAHEYFYACDAHCMICGELTNESAAHNLTHVEAKAATCTENGNIEYWFCDACGGCWDNADATGMPLNRFMVIVPAAGHSYFDDCSAICDVCGAEREVSHNIIHVEAVAADCANDGNIEYWYCDVCGAAWLDAECTLNTNLMSVILPASCSYNAIHNEGVAAGCHYTGRLENWYCANCDVYYLDAACALVTNYKSLTIPALQDTADYVAAKAPTCDEPGNVEYWICYECEQVWADAALTQLTNYKNVQLAPAHNVIHVEAKAPTCDEPGNIEYWYCDVCGSAWTDELCREVTNLKNVVLPISHNIIYVAAKDATCTENGNIEYWYCADCGAAWLDEYCHLNTNLKAVVLPAAGHIYSDIHDASCDVCGETRDIVLTAEEIIISGGASIQENIYGTGLAFKFDAYVAGVAINDGYIADYSNATVVIDGVECKLVGMGAVVNNQGRYGLTLADVDDTRVLNVVAEKAFEDAEGATCYAVRILDIPEEHYDTVIVAQSYFVYETAEGEQITIYGAEKAAAYSDYLG